AHAVLVSVPKRGKALPGLGSLRQEALGLGQQVLAGRGQGDAGVAAVEEQRAALALELQDLLAQRGLRHVERLGCRGEGAAPGDLDEVAVVPQLRHRSALRASTIRSVAPLTVGADA